MRLILIASLIVIFARCSPDYEVSYGTFCGIAAGDKVACMGDTGYVSRFYRSLRGSDTGWQAVIMVRSVDTRETGVFTSKRNQYVSKRYAWYRVELCRPLK